MGKTNSFFDWETTRVVATAAVGHFAASFDTIAARIIAILSIAILAIKLYRMLYGAAKHDPSKDHDDYEGD